ncbi:MAG: hypothetical protein JWO90_901 [Solirubrobacterales bacterium]|jgi:hypothetical protein|nr:hypothetical protein [Solirubrobacterales bacterium]
MDAPLFRMACPPGVLASAPPDWPSQLLREGNVALLPDASGLDAVDAVARALDINTVRLFRREANPEEQEATVMRWAEHMPLLWIGASFGTVAREWAVRRGPMTLLVEANGPLAEEERRRIDRFVASLGRQAE